MEEKNAAIDLAMSAICRVVTELGVTADVRKRFNGPLDSSSVDSINVDSINVPVLVENTASACREQSKRDLNGGENKKNI